MSGFRRRGLCCASDQTCQDGARATRTHAKTPHTFHSPCAAPATRRRAPAIQVRQHVRRASTFKFKQFRSAYVPVLSSVHGVLGVACSLCLPQLCSPQLCSRSSHALVRQGQQARRHAHTDTNTRKQRAHARAHTQTMAPCTEPVSWHAFHGEHGTFVSCALPH